MAKFENSGVNIIAIAIVLLLLVWTLREPRSTPFLILDGIALWNDLLVEFPMFTIRESEE